MAENKADVLVIGGGVIGVCATYYAAKAGSRVMLVERSSICSGCSRGNAGWLVPSHCIPLASPGALAKGLKWMWSSNSPFSIRPRLDWGLLQWLIAFAGACNEKRVRESIPVLKDLTFRSLELYRELCCIDGVKCSLRSNGSLMLFATSRGFEEGRQDTQLLGDSGIASEIWGVEEILHKESSIRPEIAGGILYPEDGQISPHEFVESLAAVVQRMGGTILPSTQVTGFRLERGNISSVQTTRGEFRPQTVILAAGVDSAPIARKLGLRLPIQAGKGYSFSIPSTIFNPSRPLLFSEAKIAVTPFGDRVRFGGTLELSGLDLTINTARLTAIRDNSSRYLSAMLPTKLDEQWSGLRPCTPDGLPIISRIPSVRNLVVASGHAMLGVSLGPVSGKLAAQLALDEHTDVEIPALRFSRFF